MEYPYYEFSVPVFIKSLGGLAQILRKAQVLAQSHEGGETALLQKSLASDMFPLVKQVQVATDNAKGAAARLAGVPVPSFEDTDVSITTLLERIDRTIAFLRTLSPEQFDNAPMVRVELPYFPGKHMVGDEYLKEYALPNFFFHVTTAYNIIRAAGGQLGKADYMNGIPLRDN